MPTLHQMKAKKIKASRGTLNKSPSSRTRSNQNNNNNNNSNNNNGMCDKADASGDEAVDESSTNNERTTKENEATKSSANAAEAEDLHLSKSIITPSPYQVTIDLLDATCHEIILLQGKDPECILPSYESYEILANRFNQYMNQLDPEMDECEDVEEDNGYVEAAEDTNENESAATTKNPILNLDKTTQCRVKMATLVMGVCMRLAYPQLPTTNNLPALVQMTSSEWNESYQKLGTLRELLLDGREELSGKDLLDSLNCQMEAMEVLAKLREQLQSVITEINDGREGGDENEENNTNKKKKKKAASDYSAQLRTHLEEYTRTTNFIQEKLENIQHPQMDMTYDLFIPVQMLTLKRCTNIERVQESVTTIVEGVNDMISKKVFPLVGFQCQLLKLLKEWEGVYLPQPKLFAVGYFKYDGEDSAVAAKVAGASSSQETSLEMLSPEQPTSPKRGGGHPKRTESSPKEAAAKRRGRHQKTETTKESDSDDDEWMSVKRKPTSKGRSSPGRRSGEDSPRKSPSRKAKKRPNNHDSSDDEGSLMDDTPPYKKKKTKEAAVKRAASPDADHDWNQVKKKTRKKPVPYTTEEKETLLEGVERFGKGKWAHIISYYSDVFKPNNRTSVNLKDLYRTLTKKK